MSPTAEHCEIAQSQVLLQQKQLGTRKHKQTLVSDHNSKIPGMQIS